LLKSTVPPENSARTKRTAPPENRALLKLTAPPDKRGRCSRLASTGSEGRSTLHGVSLLDISVEAGESGPVVRLSGEADLSVARQLGDALNAQVAGGARHLTVDLSRLRFADSAAIRTLIEAHLALKRQGGTLELAGIRPEMARVLSLLGVDQVIPVRPQADPGPAEAGTGGSLPDADHAG
jgi:anti-anti-sigma factor